MSAARSFITEFIAAERQNIEVGMELVKRTYPAALDIADSVAAAFDTLTTAFGKNAQIRQKTTAFDQWCSSAGVPPEELLRLSQKATLIGRAEGLDLAVLANEADQEVSSFAARACLLLRLRRDYLFGLTDLLKNRLVSATGYLRIQSESLAMFLLFANDREGAVLWLRPDRDAGSKFYRRRHKAVRGEMSSLGLDSYYQRASAISLHSRVAGLALALAVGKKDVSQQGDSMEIARLSYMDTADPRIFLLAFLDFLRFHERLITLLIDRAEEMRNEAQLQPLSASLKASLDQMASAFRPVITPLVRSEKQRKRT
ncbi:MAG: hypothetical protein KAY32_17445 [Candidatus Eisenbacteria sp.]|nr:hypothetical protein [Candidatus Eisenbacteria bacterium]